MTPEEKSWKEAYENIQIDEDLGLPERLQGQENPYPDLEADVSGIQLVEDILSDPSCYG